MRVLVCGGRDYQNSLIMSRALSNVRFMRGMDVLIEGGAEGADAYCRFWATRNRVPVLTFDADWKVHGRAAGPIRNRRMLEEGKPDLVIAFPGGKGTASMVRLANGAGVEVIRVT